MGGHSWIGVRRRVLPLGPCAENIGPFTAADCHSATAILAWFKADAGIGVTDGQGIPTWADQSGNGRHATRATAGEQPIYSTSIAGGGPAVRFTTASKGLDITGLSVVRSSYTFYMLQRLTPNQNTFGTSLSAQSVAGGFEIQPDDSPDDTLDFFISGTVFAVGLAATCGWQVITLVADSGAGKATMYKNGAQVQQINYTTDGSTDASWVLGAPHLGSSGLIFDLAEVMLYNAAHSGATVAANATCLRNRANLQAGQGV